MPEFPLARFSMEHGRLWKGALETQLLFIYRSLICHVTTGPLSTLGQTFGFLPYDILRGAGCLRFTQQALEDQFSVREYRFLKGTRALGSRPKVYGNDPLHCTSRR